MQNNPLKFIDPDGQELVLTGDDADALVSELEEKTGYQLERDAETGKVTIKEKTKRDKKIGSKHLAKLLKQIIKDDKRTLTLEVGRDQEGVIVDDGRTGKKFDFGDYKVVNAVDAKFGAALLGHVLAEGYAFAVLEPQLKNVMSGGLLQLPHIRGYYFESQVLSDYTGTRERPRRESKLPNGVRFEYTTVAYDIYFKAGADPNLYDNIDRVTVRRRPKPR